MRLACFLSPPSGERIEVRDLNFQKRRLPNPTIIYLLTPALSSFGEERENLFRRREFRFRLATVFPTPAAVGWCKSREFAAPRGEEGGAVAVFL